MVLELDGNSEYVAYVWSKTGHFFNKLKRVTAVNLNKWLKQIKLPILLIKCAHMSMIGEATLWFNLSVSFTCTWGCRRTRRRRGWTPRPRRRGGQPGSGQQTEQVPRSKKLSAKFCTQLDFILQICLLDWSQYQREQKKIRQSVLLIFN